MEPAAVKMLRIHSLKNCGQQYMQYLGFGDSSASKSLSESEPYGGVCKIEKLECTDHV
jgi:hypothetical protein